jgi:hypothetical protein
MSLPTKPLPPLANDELGNAIRTQWPRGPSDYLATIYHRFRKAPTDDAIKAVRLGYSSPPSAVADQVIAEYR